MTERQNGIEDEIAEAIDGFSNTMDDCFREFELQQKEILMMQMQKLRTTVEQQQRKMMQKKTSKMQTVSAEIVAFVFDKNEDLMHWIPHKEA